MHTVSLMSGMSQPMPAHLVLMRSLQSPVEILPSDFANKSKILMTWPVLCYPVFNAAMTLSFSSRVLSPLSFSMWEELRSWIPRDFAFS